MPYQVFLQPRDHGKSIRYWIIELKMIVESLEKNPEHKVLWTVNPKRAREIAEMLGIKSKLSIRSDIRSFGTVVRLK